MSISIGPLIVAILDQKCDNYCKFVFYIELLVSTDQSFTELVNLIPLNVVNWFLNTASSYYLSFQKLAHLNRTSNCCDLRSEMWLWWQICLLHCTILAPTDQSFTELDNLIPLNVVSWFLNTASSYNLSFQILVHLNQTFNCNDLSNYGCTIVFYVVCFIILHRFQSISSILMCMWIIFSSKNSLTCVCESRGVCLWWQMGVWMRVCKFLLLKEQRQNWTGYAIQQGEWLLQSGKCIEGRNCWDAWEKNQD